MLHNLFLLFVGLHLVRLKIKYKKIVEFYRSFNRFAVMPSIIRYSFTEGASRASYCSLEKKIIILTKILITKKSSVRYGTSDIRLMESLSHYY